MVDREKIFVGLGSNIEPREEFLNRARNVIDRRAGIQDQSTVIETDPVGVETSLKFLNQVLQLQDLENETPDSFFQFLMDAEKDIGRDRSRAPDREIDLDLLYWGDKIKENNLILPHPRAHCREFVLRSMVEVAPHFRHPSYEKTQQALLNEVIEEDCRD